MSWNEIIGEGTDLTPLQMSVRALIVFISALVLIRISGRRSFGMRSPFDNVISILIGAVLSRAVVGASPIGSTLMASLLIALLHRLFAWIAIYSDAFGRLIKGDARLLYEDGKFHEKNLRKSLITEKDFQEGLRTNANVDSLTQVKSAYVERDGSISVVKKEE